MTGRSGIGGLLRGLCFAALAVQIALPALHPVHGGSGGVRRHESAGASWMSPAAQAAAHDTASCTWCAARTAAQHAVVGSALASHLLPIATAWDDAVTRPVSGFCGARPASRAPPSPLS